MNGHPLSTLNPNRQQEISDYMTAHNWVAQFNPNTALWLMMQEPYSFSPGPFEVIAFGRTLEEAFDKAKKATVPA